MLPKLTTKQYEFVRQLGCNGGNLTDAYRNSYDAKYMKAESVHVEAQRVAKNSKVALWIDFMQKKAQEVAINELGYSAKDCFNELDDVRRRAREDKGNYNQELKAIELKGKLAGHFKDKQEVEHKGLASLLEELK